MCHPEDGIRYVGQTSQGLRVRLACHKATSKRASKSHVNSWIRKHSQNIEVQLIETCDSIEDMNEREIFWISHFRSVKDDMVNIGSGGDVGNRGIKRPDQTARMLGSKNPMYGKDRRALMDYARSFQVPATLETRAKMSASHIGKTHSEETKQKMSVSIKAAMTPEILEGRKIRVLGASNPMAKLTEDDVREIRRLHNQDGLSYYRIAKNMNVSQGNVSLICRLLSWKDVE